LLFPPDSNNKQQTTNNQQPTTNNKQQITNNKQQTTNNQQQTTKMINITVDEIQRNPLKYLSQVETGETLVIMRDCQPIAELRPIENSDKQLRPFGLCAGEFTVPDDFDSSLPEDIALRAIKN